MIFLFKNTKNRWQSSTVSPQKILSATLHLLYTRTHMPRPSPWYSYRSPWELPSWGESSWRPAGGSCRDCGSWAQWRLSSWPGTGPPSHSATPLLGHGTLPPLGEWGTEAVREGGREGVREGRKGGSEGGSKMDGETCGVCVCVCVCVCARVFVCVCVSECECAWEWEWE